MKSLEQDTNSQSENKDPTPDENEEDNNLEKRGGWGAPG